MKISEKQLKKIIKESVKKALKEGQERTPVFGLNAVDLTTDEGFDDMQYTAKVYYSEEEAIEAAKDMARAYSDWDNVINISVMAGEYELPSGDVYGEPYDIYTVSNKDEETTRSEREKRGYVRHDVDDYSVLNESQLRKIIKENVKKVLKEIVADDGYSFDGLEDYEAQQEYYSNNYSIDYVINNLKQIGFDIPTINGEFPYNIINTVRTLLGLIAGAEKEEINKGKMYEILHNYTLKYMENYQKQCQKVIQDFNYLDYKLEKLCEKYPLTQEDIEQQKRDFDV